MTKIRQIVLDTETTGIDTSEGHRIIEFGAVELVGRRPTGNHLHLYINPQRDIDEGALRVHGITLEFLADKPVFAQVADQILSFIDGAELVIHNAAFDVGFLNHEFRLLGRDVRIEDRCGILDTVQVARAKHPGQKNSLDALCRRYGIDHFNRELHGALLDAQILAEVYLVMTGGQTRLSLGAEGSASGEAGAETIRRLAADRPPLKVIAASEPERDAHAARLAQIARACEDGALWQQLEPSTDTRH